MKMMKTMNNKIRLKRFFEIGGLYSVLLRRDIRYVVPDAPLMLCARNEDEYEKIFGIIMDICKKALPTLLTPSAIIEHKEYAYNGILYYNLDDKSLDVNPYLYAYDKYYRGATL